MKKLIITLLLTVVLIGDPFDTGYFIAPTGETISWKWFRASLAVMDTKGNCVWNEGEPRDCTFAEFSIMLYYLVK